MENGHLYYELPQMKHDPYNLKGSALRVYAALYILTAKHPFTGSYRTLADWIEDISPRTVNRMVDYLVDRNLVSRDIVTNTKKPIDGIYNLDALILPEAPLPRVRYKLIMNEYQKKENDLERKMEDYRREKIVEGVRQNVEGVRHGDEGVRHGDEVLKEKKQKKNNYNIYNKDKNSNNFYLGKAVLSKNKDGVYKDEIYPPTWEMVKDYAEKHVPTISLEVAKLWLAYAASSGWEMARGRKIKDWRASLYWFDQNHIDIEKEKAARKVIQAQAGVSPDVIAMEEQMREQRRKEREQAEREANTPEALAARDAFFEKFGKK